MDPDLDSDPDPNAVADPAIFISNLHNVIKVFLLILLKVHLHHFLKIKSHTEVTKR